MLLVIIPMTLAAFYELRTIAKISEECKAEKEQQISEEKERLIREAIDKEKKKLYEQGYDPKKSNNNDNEDIGKGG